MAMSSTNAFDCFGAEHNAAADVHGTSVAPKELRMLIMECNWEQQKEKSVQGCSTFLRWSEKTSFIQVQMRRIKQMGRLLEIFERICEIVS